MDLTEHADLNTIAELMTKHRVKRLRFGSGAEVELHDSAFTQQSEPSTTASTPDVEYKPDLCPCGHDLDTAHSNDGCLLGCRVELCMSQKDKED